jgi:molybdopterin synthase sulfur carrier subunit
MLSWTVSLPGCMKNKTVTLQIEVVVFATLRKYLPDLALGETRKLQVAPSTTVAEICETLKLPREEIKVVMRNNRQAEMDTVVEDGDRLAFIPAVGGG